MPATGLIHGRPGKPYSHYWFICEDIKTTQFTAPKDSAGKSQMLLEIRSTNSYTVVPPSTWVDKAGQNPETIIWHSERDPARIDKDIAYDLGAQIASATLLAMNWPDSGTRHAAIGPLVGFLCRAGIEPDQAIKLVMTAAEVAGDSDLRDREKYARLTAAKFTNGEKVTGGPSLVEHFGEPVVQRLRSWLRVADVDAIEAMNARYFWTRINAKAVIGRETPRDTLFQPVRELYSEYANQKVQTGVDKNGEPTFKPLFPAWLEHPSRHQ